MGALIYKGRGKRMESVGGGKCVVEFNDGATMYDGVERPEFKDKGALRGQISRGMMETLKKNGVPVSYEGPDGTHGALSRELQPFPVEVVCYNVASGSFAKRMKITQGVVLPLVIIEFFFKGRGPCAPPLNVSGLKEINTITEGDVKIMQTRAIMANLLLKEQFDGKGLVLAELKLEFGKSARNETCIGDEITPDTFRAWEKTPHERIDRNRFIKEMGIDEESYRKAAELLMS